MKNLTFIFDIGSSKISLLACSVKKGKTIIITSIDKLYDGFMDGEFFSAHDLPTVFKELINEMQERLSCKIDSVYIGVPSEFCACVCKRVTRNFVPSKKLSDADIQALFDGINDFPNNKDYTVISFSPLEYDIDGVKTLQPTNKKISNFIMDCCYVLVKKDFITIIEQSLDEFNLDIEYMSTSLAQAHLCMKDMNNTMSPIAIVDVGHITTSVAIAKGEGLMMLSSFSLGGGHITADLMQVRNLSFNDAELIKRKVSLTIQSKKDEKYSVYTKGKSVNALISITNEVVNARLEHIAKIINKVLEQNPIFNDIPVYITGDGVCNFRGIKNLLEVVLNRPVYMFKTIYNDGNNQYQTSKLGLSRLVGELV